ncbi:MAG: peptidoglycan bridge formation glycyltransferase FemA/FemB family protein [Patescibacteria group bacterium]
MDIQICTDKQIWDKGLLTLHNNEFLQSWEWGEFQRAIGKEVIRLQWDDGQAQVIIHELPLGMRYAYAPRLQTTDYGLQLILNFLKKTKYVYARIELTQSLSVVSSLSSVVVANRQPQHTLTIDLAKSPEKILQAMHPKTRYNIHLAEKRGVVVKEEKNSEVFWRLNAETTARDHFKSHDKMYYTKMLASPLARQLTAYLDGTPIVSHILVIYGDTCTYLHGASSDTHRNTMAPYLLQWRGMEMAKSRGCTYYDLWGVAPLKNPKSEIRNPKSCFNGYCWEAAHPWTGVTRFKAGFGGEPRSYPEAVDVIFQPMKYALYKLARKFL